MQEWQEQDHPRDTDGRFTEKDATARKITYRQNTPYSKILADDKAREAAEEPPLDWKPVKKKPMGERLTGHDSYTGNIAEAEKGAPMSFAQADGHRCNPKYGTEEGYSRNCQTCTAVYLARLHGYNVEALPYSEDSYTDLLAKNPIDIYIDDGKFRAYDPQTGMTFNLQDFSAELKERNTSGHTLYDITDCKVDEGYANKIMRKVKTDER